MGQNVSQARVTRTYIDPHTHARQRGVSPRGRRGNSGSLGELRADYRLISEKQIGGGAGGCFGNAVADVPRGVRECRESDAKEGSGWYGSFQKWYVVQRHPEGAAANATD